jgi:hypothetical protein
MYGISALKLATLRFSETLTIPKYMNLAKISKNLAILAILFPGVIPNVNISSSSGSTALYEPWPP